jgi:cytochrome c peroxidase
MAFRLPSLLNWSLHGFLPCLVPCTVLCIAAHAIAGEPEHIAPPLSLHFHHVFGSEPLLDGNVALRTQSNILSVTRVAYLLSNFALTTQAGDRIAIDMPAALIDATARVPREVITLSSVPAGEYTTLSFDIGLPSELNHADPAQWAPTHPLNPSLNNLHWNWQGGYVFFALEGRWVQADDTLGGYVFHVATNEHLTRVSVPAAFAHARTDASPTHARITLDLARVFDGAHTIALSADPASHTTHSGPGDALAAKLSANLAQAFSFTGILAHDESETTDKPPEPVPPPPGTTPYAWHAPKHFPRVALPHDNPLTREGVALGEKLFFDQRLSGNNSQSCASCHVPAQAFTDGKPLAEGAYGDVGRRNTMTLFNLAWSQDSGFTWDGRKARIRDQALQPIEDAREMRIALPEAIDKLSQDDAYADMFEQAFGSQGITSDRIGLALEQYLLTLVAARSKYDRVVQGTDTFTPQEQRGFELFNAEYDPARGQLGADCFHCHGGHLFTNHQFVSNGLDGSLLRDRGLDVAEPADASREQPARAHTDPGRAGVTDKLIDHGRFKVPTLRNIAKTAPYMHDGRFATLMDVLRHYSEGVQPSPSLDPNLAKHLRANARIPGSEHHAGVNLSDEDKAALVAFLETLTDDPLPADQATDGEPPAAKPDDRTYEDRE